MLNGNPRSDGHPEEQLMSENILSESESNNTIFTLMQDDPPKIKHLLKKIFYY
jgi:hypothetical protein